MSLILGSFFVLMFAILFYIEHKEGLGVYDPRSYDDVKEGKK